MNDLQLDASTPAMRTFLRDGAPPLRAKATEARRRSFRSREGLRADYSLWHRSRSEGGWIAAVEIGDPDGANRRAAFAGSAAEVTSELEAWRPAWPSPVAGARGADDGRRLLDVAAAAAELRLAEARLEHFLRLTIGEVLAEWSQPVSRRTSSGA